MSDEFMNDEDESFFGYLKSLFVDFYECLRERLTRR